MVDSVAQPVQIMDLDFSNPENIQVTLNMGGGTVIKKASELGGVGVVLKAVRQAISSYTTDRGESNRLLKAFNQLVDI